MSTSELLFSLFALISYLLILNVHCSILITDPHAKMKHMEDEAQTCPLQFKILDEDLW